jgi:hypothetical protein
MFDFFKRKNHASASKDTVKSAVQMMDMNGIPLQEGDIVECLRYNMGRCRVIVSGQSYGYQSLATGNEVSWLKMVDAATSFQKVVKIIEVKPPSSGQ